MVSVAQKRRRMSNLDSLSNVVLLCGRGAKPSIDFLEQKIAERVEREFPDPSVEESEYLTELKGTSLKFADRVIKNQGDKEIFIQIGQNVRRRDVHLFHKFSNVNEDLMELLIFGDALKRADVESVTLYLPYMPYQRQDKKDDGRVPITAKLLFNLLQASYGNRLRRIVTADLHARQAEAHFEGPVTPLSAIPEFAAYYRNLFAAEFTESEPPVYIVSPDSGGSKRAQHLAKLLGVQYVVLDKKRTGHSKADTTLYVPVDVSGMKTILVDDMVDSGSSLVGEYENQKIGPVQYLTSLNSDVHICATHRLLSQKNGIAAEDRFRQAGAHALFTDSLPEKTEGYYDSHKDWMSVLSLDHGLAKAFYCGQVGESISAFLRNREDRLKAERLDFVLRGDGARTLDLG